MRNIMVDIETLGHAPKSVILSIGATHFDKGGLSLPFYTRIDIGSSLLAGCHVEPATLNWWRKQNTEPIKRAFFAPEVLHLSDALVAFQDYLGNKNQFYLWAKGPDYDCVALKHVYDLLLMDTPWQFRNTRDVRTVIGFVNPSEVPTASSEGEPHDAYYDACIQSKLVISACRLLNLPL